MNPPSKERIVQVLIDRDLYQMYDLLKEMLEDYEHAEERFSMCETSITPDLHLRVEFFLDVSKLYISEHEIEIPTRELCRFFEAFSTFHRLWHDSWSKAGDVALSRFFSEEEKQKIEALIEHGRSMN